MEDISKMVNYFMTVLHEKAVAVLKYYSSEMNVKKIRKMNEVVQSVKSA